MPGVSIAVTDRGRVVFVRGYGYADIAKREPVRPASLSRIASISKPITAVAMLQLIERGDLNLDDKILDRIDYQDDIEAAGDAFDERYAYSNFGYCLLRRLIEKVTGESYEGYVKKHVLAPLGITSMKVGATRLEQSNRPGWQRQSLAYRVASRHRIDPDPATRRQELRRAVKHPRQPKGGVSRSRNSESPSQKWRTKFPSGLTERDAFGQNVTEQTVCPGCVFCLFTHRRRAGYHSDAFSNSLAAGHSQTSRL